MTIVKQVSGKHTGSGKQRHSLRALRDTNVTSLLAAIWNHGPISRTDLARVTGLAPSSITRLTRDLEQAGLIRETSKGQSSGGRQPVLLALDAGAGLVIAVDLSGIDLRGAALDATGQAVVTLQRPFTGTGTDAVRAQIERTVEELLTHSAVAGRRVLGIGISVPGGVDRATGTILDVTNLDLRNLPIGAILTERFGLPVFAEHDTAAAAIAEKYYGAGRGASNLIYITVSGGIGAGIILQDEVYRGEGGVAGELGHITVERDGQVCACGKRGCLETVASGPAIVAAAQRVLQRSRSDDTRHATVAMVAQAAADGDHLAQQILNGAADYLALAISTLVCILNIRLVIVGGDVAEAGPRFFDPLRQSLLKYQLYSNIPEIVPAQLKQDAPLAGVGMVTLQQVLNLVPDR